MPTITIVGAGQAGLQLALGLLRNGYDVTVVSNRTPEQIAGGRVTSSQCMFDSSLALERAIGAEFWGGAAPPIEQIALTVPAPPGSPAAGGKAFSWGGRLTAPAQSVDQRVKMPRWLEEVTSRGGSVVIEDAGVPELERYAAGSDLVIVATGKSEIARLFRRDPARSAFTEPQRALALTYLHGLTPRPEHSAVDFNLIPGVGEYFVFPALTTSGPCHIMTWEAIPGGPFDAFGTATTPAGHLATAKRLLREFLPWEYERAAGAELTDPNGVLAGRFTPVVREPVASLPSGALVLGLADLLVLNDPITGQGANNAAKGAASYLASILARGDAPFDRAFMEAAFESYWTYASQVTTWTNAMLGAPPPHVLELLNAAATHQAIADRFANGFDNPPDFFGWFMDPAGAAAYLADVRTLVPLPRRSPEEVGRVGLEPTTGGL
ncbi:MAG: FAD-binding oxidoreductase [Nocardiopsaceae bacterium]|nr:FAD-binding oxidoreductase [Nocardiopsaceae bacterium]